MKKRLLFCFGLIATTSAAFATPYDGIYRPASANGAAWTCRSMDGGMDGGAVAIQGDRLQGVGNSCLLTNPVDVRGMSATLYDAECSGEGATYTERLMLMKSHDGGVVVIRDGWAANWARCN
ncbi:MAG: hypothetical protein CSA73_01540 [Rhodobacterales bacterium]|nr:MAG: hypothetical protein CSA73_01540 [Rhodobacterales bacterium]